MAQITALNSMALPGKFRTFIAKPVAALSTSGQWIITARRRGIRSIVAVFFG